jgi:hypothetical protein
MLPWMKRHATKIIKNNLDGMIFIEDWHDEIFRKIKNVIFPIDLDDNTFSIILNTSSFASSR